MSANITTHDYLKAYAERHLGKPPEGVEQQWDGFYYKDGIRYCEDCWKPIPKYVDFPQGLTSPESDGDRGGNFAKHRMTMMAASHYERLVREPLRKAVCLDCYNMAFMRFYPGAPLPELSRLVRNTVQYLEPEPEPVAFVPDPMTMF